MQPNDDDEDKTTGEGDVTGSAPVNAGDDAGVVASDDDGTTEGTGEVNPTPGAPTGAPVTGMGDEPVVSGETAPEAGEEEEAKEEGDEAPAA